MGWIYIFLNLIDHKIYIGKWCGKRVEDRRNQHKSGHGNLHLYRAIQKYGWDNFIFDTLHDNIPHADLPDLEIKEIARFDCNKCQGGWGYNATDGGEGTTGYVPSAETRQQIYGEKHWNFGKGHLMSGENNPMFGKKRPDITGENHPMFGKAGEKSPTTRPEYMQAKWEFFLWYPLLKDISEVRRKLREIFDDVSRNTIYNWTRKWQAELKTE